MSSFVSLLFLVFGVSCSSPGPGLRWVKVNFHSHMKTDLYPGDDGRKSPKDAFEQYQNLGFDLNVLSAHSPIEDSNAAWLKLKTHVLELPLTIERAVGCEINVARGPKFREEDGNLNHVGAVGISRAIPSELPLKETLDRIHAAGGIAIVNHPGPPRYQHWERGYWEQEEIRDLFDAIEVYNGNSLKLTVHFEGRYRHAVGKLGMNVAAVTGCDTHGRKGDRRSEATWVLARSPKMEDVLEAVRARRTVATSGYEVKTLKCPNLGAVVSGNRVSLSLDLGERVDRLQLWENGKLKWEKEQISKAGFEASVEKLNSYVWQWQNGRGRGITSAIWTKPASR